MGVNLRAAQEILGHSSPVTTTLSKPTVQNSEKKNSSISYMHISQAVNLMQQPSLTLVSKSSITEESA